MCIRFNSFLRLGTSFRHRFGSSFHSFNIISPLSIKVAHFLLLNKYCTVSPTSPTPTILIPYRIDVILLCNKNTLVLLRVELERYSNFNTSSPGYCYLKIEFKNPFYLKCFDGKILFDLKLSKYDVIKLTFRKETVLPTSENAHLTYIE